MSKEAINRARETATALGQNPDCFSVADQKYMDSLEDSSMDAVLAMGYFRYLDHDDQESLYNSVKRVLKPNGRFNLVQQNLLFEAFALNEGMLNFWADLISDISDVEALLEEKSIGKALAKHLTVPQRKYGSISISRLMYRDRKTPET